MTEFSEFDWGFGLTGDVDVDSKDTAGVWFIGPLFWAQSGIGGGDEHGLEFSSTKGRAGHLTDGEFNDPID